LAGLRALTLADVADGLALSSASGWNQTAADWERAFTLPGAAAWGIEREGRIVSTTTAIRYGDDLAWIGMVLTAEAYRGQGLASQLMTAALAWLSRCRTVKLDATAQGAPIYRRFGFVDEGLVTRYIGRPPAGSPDRATEPGPDAFEADRAALLAALGTPACLADGSFAYGRPGRNAPFFGPCVAAEESGGELLQWFAGEVAGEFMLDRMGPAPEGFRPARELMRMYRGEPKPTSPRQFAFAGFEFG
jgi:GNAT superfamily N-acetyltransferase